MLSEVGGPRAALYNGFIGYRRSLGYGYPQSTVHLVDLMARHLDSWPGEYMCRDAVEAFRAKRDGEAWSTRDKRASVVRQYALYLERIGAPCHVPDARRGGGGDIGFAPRIITAAEMARVIAVVDAGGRRHYGRDYGPEHSLLVRLLWCCGLRLGEALALTAGDVGGGAESVTVRRAKCGGSRTLPLSGTMSAFLSRHMKLRGLDTAPGDCLLFPGRAGEALSRHSAAKAVKASMLAAGVTKGDGTAPRVHDIRHSYAVAALAKMEAEGVEARRALPLLCAYMGHSDIKSTELYLRLTDEARGAIESAMSSAYESLFPEVG